MVANVVNGLPGAAAKTGGVAAEAEAAATPSDGFLQALAGLLVDVGPQAATAVVPQAALATDSSSDREPAENAADAAAIDPSLLLSLPGWIPTAEMQVKTAALPDTAARSGGSAQISPAAIDAALAPQAGSQNETPMIAEATAAASSMEAVSEESPLAEASPMSSQAAPKAPATAANAPVEKADWASIFSAHRQTDAANSRDTLRREDFTMPSMSAAQAEQLDESAPDLIQAAAAELDLDADEHSAATESAKLDRGIDMMAPLSEFGSESAAAASNSDSIASIAAAAAGSSRGVESSLSPAPQSQLDTQSLHARVGTPQWRDRLGTQLNWMVENGKHTASLKLSPEHLGPMEVRIDLDQDRASVWFTAAHSETRHAIEQAIPRLREMMESQGMSLTDAGVFRDPPREQPRTPNAASAPLVAEAREERTPSAAEARLGLLDAYA